LMHTPPLLDPVEVPQSGKASKVVHPVSYSVTQPRSAQRRRPGREESLPHTRPSLQGTRYGGRPSAPLTVGTTHSRRSRSETVIWHQDGRSSTARRGASPLRTVDRRPHVSSRIGFDPPVAGRSSIPDRNRSPIMPANVLMAPEGCVEGGGSRGSPDRNSPTKPMPGQRS